LKKILISGVDGSGKSTIISKLKNELSISGQKVVVTHTRLKLFGVKKSKNLIGERPSYGLPRSTFVSLIKLIAFYLEELLFKMINRDINYIIYDRSIHDILIDPGRFRMRITPLILLSIKVMFKLPKTIIYLSGDLMKIKKRKPELSIEEMVTINKGYKKIYSEFSHLKLDTTKLSVDICVKKVINYVKDN
tara:strand:+ start:423 stop:995 length:573 start_codon:yes stop_codon:yes gene_type:complete